MCNLVLSQISSSAKAEHRIRTPLPPCTPPQQQAAGVRQVAPAAAASAGGGTSPPAQQPLAAAAAAGPRCLAPMTQQRPPAMPGPAPSRVTAPGPTAAADSTAPPAARCRASHLAQRTSLRCKDVPFPFQSFTLHFFTWEQNWGSEGNADIKQIVAGCAGIAEGISLSGSCATVLAESSACPENMHAAASPGTRDRVVRDGSQAPCVRGNEPCLINNLVVLL